MFQLYKDRDFGAYISDTIDFFKKFGKHYFKNYFIVNGIFLMILVVLIYFFSKIYMEFLQSSMTTVGQNNNYFTEYFNNNLPLFVISLLVFILLIGLISMINYAIPSLYIELYENKGTNFETKELIRSIKQNLGRVFLFFVASFFVVLPVFFIVLILNLALCFILIGIPLFLITIPALMVWISLSFNDYLLGKSSYFTSLGNGYSMLKSNFWPAVGSSLIMFIIVYILQSILTMIPYMFGVASIFASGQNLEDPANTNEVFGTISVLMIILMVFSTLFGYLFQNILNVQQVLIYYSQLEGSNQNSTNNEIELIGSEIE
ncbi:MAG: hypothetical protein KBC56_03045 [Flavobacterium sp.]|nr:hypothetical protein [Flavobacterium sp.]